MKFKTEHEAIEWIRLHIALYIKPKRKKKYEFINPFTSDYARNQVVKHLGEELFKQQEK